MLSSKNKSFLLVSLIFLLGSCTVTTTRTKDPVFNDINQVEQELRGLITAENINLNGKEITSNKKTTSELEVSITNGKNIPAGDDERKALGKSIATTIKNNLKDSREFDTYKVLFVTKTESGGLTKRNWVGNIFSSTEL